MVNFNSQELRVRGVSEGGGAICSGSSPHYYFHYYLPHHSTLTPLQLSEPILKRSNQTFYFRLRSFLICCTYFLSSIFYTFSGSGGCDLSGNKRTAEESFDQKLTKSNAAIALSCNAEFNDKKGNESTNWQKGKPVRVHRSYKFQKYSKYAPEDGVRCVI